MNHNTPGLSVHHQLPVFTQTYVHQVSDAIQPSHPLSSPSPPAPNPSQIATIILQKRAVPKLSRLITQGFILMLTGQQVNCDLTDGDGVWQGCPVSGCRYLGLLLTAGWIESCSTCPHFGTLAQGTAVILDLPLPPNHQRLWHKPNHRAYTNSLLT